MIGDKLTEEYQPQPPATSNRFQRNIPKAQETIYAYLLDIVKYWPADDVLVEFHHLFIHHVNTVSSEILPALYEIVFSNQEHEFRNTLKRSCYILINNWDITRKHEAIRKLILLFEDPILQKHTMSPTLKRLRAWLRYFLTTPDFQELKLFASRYDEHTQIHWTERYTSYLLVPQYINLKNPIEQREAARALSRRLKDKFKFDLAFYTAHSDAAVLPIPDNRRKKAENPTVLGDDGLRLIKMIVGRRGRFSYANLANIFVKQTETLNYQDFKQSLQEYLIFSVEKDDFVQTLRARLSEKLDTLYQVHEDKPINDALLLRTTNRVIEYLTTEDHKEPAPLFSLLLSQGSPLTLVIVLLKLILICRYARTHLEARIADLITYYQDVPQADCQWVINFFEIFNITMTIYAENIEYNLVDMRNQSIERKENANWDAYRIFSTLKSGKDVENDEMEFLSITEDMLDSEDGDPSKMAAEPGKDDQRP